MISIFVVHTVAVNHFCTFCWRGFFDKNLLRIYGKNRPWKNIYIFIYLFILTSLMYNRKFLPKLLHKIDSGLNHLVQRWQCRCSFGGFCNQDGYRADGPGISLCASSPHEGRWRSRHRCGCNPRTNVMSQEGQCYEAGTNVTNQGPMLWIGGSMLWIGINVMNRGVNVMTRDQFY
jgi:hypothetical protein